MERIRLSIYRCDTKIVCNRSGSGNEKSDGIWANMNCIRLRLSTPNTIKPFKILHWDAGLRYINFTVATNHEIREITEKSEKHFFYGIVREKSGKFMKNSQSQGKVREKWNCFASVLKMLTSHVLFPYFVKAQELSMLHFAVQLTNLRQGKTGIIQWKWKLENNGHPN